MGIEADRRRYSRKDIEVLACTDPIVSTVMNSMCGTDWTYQEALICMVCMLVKQKDGILADLLKLAQHSYDQETIDGRD